MKVVFLSSEVAPFAKTGGLADVTGALPKFLFQLGVKVKVFLPLYREVKKKNFPLRKVLTSLEMEWGGEKTSWSLWELEGGDYPVYFIEKNDYFDRDFLYGTPKGDYPDNSQRFAFFCHASLGSLKHLGFSPEILHCHDWQTAMALAYLKFTYSSDPFFARTRSLFTIHNLAYQGLFPYNTLTKIGLPDWLFSMENLEFYGKVNFLKAGILYSTAINTVSPRYSREIQTPEYGYGLDGLLRKRSRDIHGILNGVDYKDWNPAEDEFLINNYDACNLAGKKDCKKDLLRIFGLANYEKDTPLVGMVSRLASQKGLDLICEALPKIFDLGVCLVILGTGDEKIQKILKGASEKFPSKFGLKIAFDEALAHKIYAGSDILLIPSRYEPCGLTQMYSLRYGTIPVVRATGGLDDSIQEFNPGTGSGNGFKFEDYSVEAMISALERAVNLYQQKDGWKKLIQNAMTADFSWERSAREYLCLYKKILSSAIF